MTASSRRNFLKTSVVGIAAVASTQALAQAQNLPLKTIAEVEALAAKKDVESTASWNDGLVHPAPFKNPFAQGKDRGLALGGGGTPLIAWYAGYCNALKKAGVDLSVADVVVGTSAGSIFGAMLTSGHMWRLMGEMDLFADFPKLLAEMMPALKFNASQLRAQRAELTVHDGSLASIQRIGKAAMASFNPDGVANHYKVMRKLLTASAWPSDGMFTTAIDCFTGQRIVVSKADNVPIDVACAASSSAPGQVGPTFIKDRLCMDGGMSQSSTHSDVIAGVKRAIVISLGDGTINEQKQGLRLSSLPNTINQEVKDLEGGGTKTKHIVVGLPPGLSKVENLLDPKWIAPYLKYGNDRGIADIAMMKEFWA
ncbi:patatin-like phospholipase family protein [Polynucleobacter sp. AP-RePozz3-80-G7]|uniref:patatin-like phospholipase family protein n=1 Tax=Polynucleobacter sp. AP-RePozz3-80-G7 TaxID=2689105 RepID=UPI001C0ADAE2|nr:patatin-like phospholipase family protein [Polynucleobacter sp. AP-RePozz3-80-G7]MBU3638165.1 patatin-like phospholipase family protein [Polynucleobacter sp. AP-RePozz3-80-G7]